MRSIIVAAAVLFLFGTASAQQFSINISTQPIWGPAGYDHVEYYYLPDIDAYYYVPQHKFIYLEGGRWRRTSNLPSRYRDFDLYNAHKVVMNDRRPYRQANIHRDKYATFKGVHDQQPIRDARDAKYFVNKNHPEHNRWVEQNRRGQGNQGKGQGNRGNGRGNKGNGRGNQGNGQGNQGNGRNK